MPVFDKKDIINISEEDLKDAKLSSMDFANEADKRRAFINVLGVRLAMNMLFSQKIKASNVYSLYTIQSILEKIDIADIYVEDIKIDVRLVFNKEEIFIPKFHFEYGLTPDIYLVLELNKDFSSATYLGLFEPKNLDKSNVNKDFYFFEYENLEKPKKIKKYLKDFSKEIEPQISETPENIEDLFLGFIDEETTDKENLELFKYLANDIKLREKMVEFENFEIISKKTAQNNDLIHDSVLDIVGTQKLYEEEEQKEISGTTLEEELQEIEQEESEEQEEFEQASEEEEEILTEEYPEMEENSEATEEIEFLEEESATEEPIEEVYEEDTLTEEQAEKEEEITLEEIPAENIELEEGLPSLEETSEFEEKSALDEFVEQVTEKDETAPVEKTEVLNQEIEEQQEETLLEGDIEELSLEEVPLLEDLPDINTEEELQEIEQEEPEEKEEFEQAPDEAEDESIKILEEEEEEEQQQQFEPEAKIIEDNIETMEANPESIDSQMEETDSVISEVDNLINEEILIKEEVSEIEESVMSDSLTDFEKAKMQFEETDFNELEIETQPSEEYLDLDKFNVEEEPESKSDYETISFESLAGDKSKAGISKEALEEVTPEILEPVQETTPETSAKPIEEKTAEDKESAETIDFSKYENIQETDDFISEIDDVLKNVGLLGEKSSIPSASAAAPSPSENKFSEDIPEDEKIHEPSDNQKTEPKSNEKDPLQVLFKGLRESIPTAPLIGKESFSSISKDKKMILAASAASVVLISFVIGGNFLSNKSNGPEISQDMVPAPIEAGTKDLVKDSSNLNQMQAMKAMQTEQVLLPETGPQTSQMVSPSVQQIQPQPGRDMSQAISEAFLSEPIEPNISKIAWEVPEELAYDDEFRKYLQIAGKNLRLNLQNGFLLSQEIAYSDKIVVDLSIDGSGNLQSNKIVTSSGSKQLDKVVLQSVKETLRYLKMPADTISDKYVKVTLIINF